jgi:hypothetical protein
MIFGEAGQGEAGQGEAGQGEAGQGKANTLPGLLPGRSLLGAAWHGKARRGEAWRGKPIAPWKLGAKVCPAGLAKVGHGTARHGMANTIAKAKDKADPSLGRLFCRN